jgi:CDP-diacylglycerol--glycerol-3-phosphate 3-phosphatidyltransferase
MPARVERPGDDKARRVIFNLPNVLTILRILALPFCAWALLAENGESTNLRVMAWFLFFIVAMTDVIDGRLARSSNQITDFGELWDPIADKALLATAMISLNYLSLLPIWVTLIILGREFAVTLLRLAFLKRGVIPANRGGKLKTLTQNFAIGFFILPLPEYLFLPRDIFLGFAVFLTLFTGFKYFQEALTSRALGRDADSASKDKSKKSDDERASGERDE